MYMYICICIYRERDIDNAELQQSRRGSKCGTASGCGKPTASHEDSAQGATRKSTAGRREDDNSPRTVAGIARTAPTYQIPSPCFSSLKPMNDLKRMLAFCLIACTSNPNSNVLHSSMA